VAGGYPDGRCYHHTSDPDAVYRRETKRRIQRLTVTVDGSMSVLKVEMSRLPPSHRAVLSWVFDGCADLTN